MACEKRKSKYLGVAVGVIIGLPIFIGACLYTLPILEGRWFPIIDPKSDTVTNVRLEGGDLCWRSEFDKLRTASIARITRVLRTYGSFGNVGRVTAVPRRVGGPGAPNVDIVDLVPGHYVVDWCQALWTTGFVKAEVTFEAAYITHGLWMVPVTRPTVVYTPAP